MISILIVDDDENKIFSIIKVIHSFYINQVEIKQAICVQEAIELMQNNNFHLLISDLMMPLRPDEKPIEKGGEVLIREIYKKSNNINTPIYIVGLTQFPDVKHNFSGVWKVWEYNSASKDWHIKLKHLIHHISKVDSKIIKVKIETVFVEGITDKQALTLAVSLFFGEYLNKISIETLSFSAGASWVERQLIIWGKTLFWKDSAKSEYLKAVGIFDYDDSGNKSIAAVRNQIGNDTAENKTFSIVKLDRKYAKHLIAIYLKGIDLPITLEEMFPAFFWKYALKQGWLIKRESTHDMIIQRDCLHNNDMAKYIASLELSEEESLFVKYRFHENYKTKCAIYIQGLDEEKQKALLYAFEPLIKDVLIKLKIIGVGSKTISSLA